MSAREDVAVEAQAVPDAAVPAVATQRKPKPAATNAPKPVIGYLATSDLDGLAVQPMRGWYFLPPLDLSVKAAENTRAGFQGMSPTTPAKPIYKVTITFELVERGGT